MAKHVFYLSFSLSSLFVPLGFVTPGFLVLSALLSFVAILSFAVHLFSLLEEIARNTGHSADAQMEAARSLYKIEKAAEAKERGPTEG